MIPVDPASIAPHAGPTPAPADTARSLIEGQLAMLSRLAAIGMEIAEACGRDAKAVPAEPSSAHHSGLVFARVARAVRMTIALQSRLMKDLGALDREDARAEMRRKDDRRIRLSRLVDQAARAQVAARRESAGAFWSDEDAIEHEIEQLSCDAYERLTEAEDGDLWGRPFDEVVADICRDLGLSPDWTARVSAAVQAPSAGRDAPRGREPDPPWPSGPRYACSEGEGGRNELYRPLPVGERKGPAP